MSDQNVTNNHSSPLGLPNGQTIQPGATILVVGFDRVRRNRTVAAWLKAGLLAADDDDADTIDPVEQTDTRTKEDILTELAALGIQRTTRSSIENLRKELDEAKAKNAGLPGLSGLPTL